MRTFNMLGALASAFVAAALLVACGGGGNPGTSVFAGGGTATGSTSTVVAAPSLTLALSSATVTAAAPATVTATVKNAAGAGVAGRVVSFSSTGGLGTFSIATALTDATGTASVALYPAASTTTGADSVIASSNVDGTPVTASQGFQLTATNVTISSFTSDVGTAQLSAYSQTNLTLKVAGAATGTPVSVSLTSTCVTAGKATLTPAGTASSTNGTITFTYKDSGGCGATSAIDTLQATVVGGTSNASLSLALAAPAASSITFASAAPATIYLKASGFTESSTVTFKVVDIAGNALPGRSVLLEPTTLAGGLTLDGSSAAVTKLSDSTGVITVIVNSGTVPTPVRIKATLVGTNITTVSSSLSIAVGLPTELSFSLSQASKNIEGLDLDGITNTYMIIASDRLGNPVPAGTAINFVTEGGQIEATKQISLASGLASATANFVSASPRPADGRITVLAYTLGEESFLDTNGDNVYTSGEAFQDLGDVYLDRKFDGAYDQAADQFISLSLTGTSACNTFLSTSAYPTNLLALDTSIPSRASTCDGVWGRAYVRRATETVLSSSSARPLWGTKPATLSNACSVDTIPVDSNSSANFYVLGAGGLQGVPASGTFSFLVADANDNRLNPMAAGTTVSATGSTGLTPTVTGGSPVASSNSVTSAVISYDFATGTTSGTVTLSFKSPSGRTTVVSLPLTTGAGTGAACAL